MKRRTHVFFSGFLMALCLLSVVPWQSAWAAPAYRVLYKNCTVTAGPAHLLLVNNTAGASSSVKIQYLKNVSPTILFDMEGNSTNAPAGTLYMIAPATIPGVQVIGPLGMFYTEAKVRYLSVPSGVNKIIAKKTWIDYVISEAAIQSIKMDAIVNSYGAGHYATTRIQIAPPTPLSTPVSISLSGIVLEKLYCSSPISILNVATKKGKVASVPVVSVSGIGRVTPDALTLPADPYDCVAQSFKRIQATGATIEPDRLTCGDGLDKMQSTAVRFNGSLTGGIIGRSASAISAGYASILVGASTMGLIYGQDIVDGTFVAGIGAGPSSPAYHEGTIQKIATHPRLGRLIGTAHVASGTGASIKFVPTNHPIFQVCEDATSHPAPM